MPKTVVEGIGTGGEGDHLHHALSLIAGSIEFEGCRIVCGGLKRGQQRVAIMPHRGVKRAALRFQVVLFTLLRSARSFYCVRVSGVGCRVLGVGCWVLGRLVSCFLPPLV